jgi:hypothetical protein
MPIIDERYLNSACKVRTMENLVLTMGHIREITDDSVTIRNEPELPGVITYNKKVKLSIFNDKLGYKTLIATVYGSTTKILKLIELQDISDFEKRTYYRLNVYLKGEIALLPAGAEEKPEGAETHEVLIENVSLSGVLIKCPMYLKPRDRIAVTIYTPFGRLDFTAVVIRTEKDRDERFTKYGCEFEVYPDKVGDALWKYMMHKELEDIRRARGGLSVIGES